VRYRDEILLPHVEAFLQAHPDMTMYDLWAGIINRVTEGKNNFSVRKQPMWHQYVPETFTQSK
jgi:hypothetical protein